jgi:hypothetical protein
VKLTAGIDLVSSLKTAEFYFHSSRYLRYIVLNFIIRHKDLYCHLSAAILCIALTGFKTITDIISTRCALEDAVTHAPAIVLPSTFKLYPEAGCTLAGSG